MKIITRYEILERKSEDSEPCRFTYTRARIAAALRSSPLLLETSGPAKFARMGGVGEARLTFSATNMLALYHAWDSAE